MQSSYLDSLPNSNEEHSSLDIYNILMKLWNYYLSGFSERKVKIIQKYTSVLYAKATQFFPPATEKKVYFKTSHVPYIIIAAHSLSDMVTAGTALQIDTDWIFVQAPPWLDTNLCEYTNCQANCQHYAQTRKPCIVNLAFFSGRIKHMWLSEARKIKYSTTILSGHDVQILDLTTQDPRTELLLWNIFTDVMSDSHILGIYNHQSCRRLYSRLVGHSFKKMVIS